MSLVPPTDTFLGLLEIDEVFFEYEGPKFFSAVSKAGRRYVAIMVTEDDESETYLYVPVSDTRYKALTSGLVRPRELFTEPEDGKIFRVTADYSARSNKIECFAPFEIDDSQLPTEDATLRLPTETRPHFRPEQLTTESRREGRALLAFEIEPTGMMRTELPLRSLSRISGALQDTIDALAQEVAGRPTAKGAIPQEIIKETELVFRESLAASFVLVAASTDEDQLMVSDLLVQSCRRLLELVNDGADPGRLRSLVADHGPRVRAKYRSLLEALQDEGTGVSAFIATPSGEDRRATLKATEVRSSLDALRSIGTEVIREYLDHVYLVGVNLRTGSFELYDPHRHVRYSGYMETEARSEIAGLPTGFDHLYSATILVQQQYSNYSDEVTKTYRLVGIGPPYGGVLSENDPIVVAPLEIPFNQERPPA